MAGYPTTDTFASLIDEVIVSLQGFGANADQVCTLTSAMTTSSTSFTTNSTTLGKGIVEIDQELIYILSYNSGTSTATVAPWGRGWKGTAAATHALNSAVFVAPTYPRSIVAREINNVIRSVYPQLFDVNSTDITMNSINWQYQLPANCDRILSVDWKYSATVNVTSWQPLHGWEQVQSANTTDFTTGSFIAVNDPLPANTILHVTYMSPPTLLTNDTDQFATVTGLPASSRDVIVYGAASRLLPWMDGAHVAQESVPSDAQDQVRPPGVAMSVAKQVQQNYLMALSRERAALLARYPLKAHKVRNG